MLERDFKMPLNGAYNTLSHHSKNSQVKGMLQIIKPQSFQKIDTKGIYCNWIFWQEISIDSES